MKKAIHKFNNGKGCNICHRCSKIINTGFTDELYCSKKCEITEKLKRIEILIKYYYDRGTNKEKLNEIKRKLLKYGK